MITMNEKEEKYYKDLINQQIPLVFEHNKDFLPGKKELYLKGVNNHTKRIRREYPEAVKKARGISEVFEKELTMMGSLFSAIADKRGRTKAQEFMIGMMRNVAAFSMPAIYQISDLVKCEGDVFDNYKKMNRALFNETNRMGTWKHDGFHETKDLLEFKVTSCANIELFEAIDCPELNEFGCEHDLGGYPQIEEATNSEFRRPCTLAKSGDCCHFKFYRKGTAPVSAELNK